MTGVYRFVRHDHLLRFLAQGWQWKADLGRVHGQWSSLMWWCNGSCRDGEPPTERRGNGHMLARELDMQAGDRLSSCLQVNRTC